MSVSLVLQSCLYSLKSWISTFSPEPCTLPMNPLRWYATPFGISMLNWLLTRMLYFEHIRVIYSSYLLVKFFRNRHVGETYQVAYSLRQKYSKYSHIGFSGQTWHLFWFTLRSDILGAIVAQLDVATLILARRRSALSLGLGRIRISSGKLNFVASRLWTLQ